MGNSLLECICDGRGYWVGPMRQCCLSHYRPETTCYVHSTQMTTVLDRMHRTKRRDTEAKSKQKQEGYSLFFR